jgi:hypothetical protein
MNFGAVFLIDILKVVKLSDLNVLSAYNLKKEAFKPLFFVI